MISPVRLSILVSAVVSLALAVCSEPSLTFSAFQESPSATTWEAPSADQTRKTIFEWRSLSADLPESSIEQLKSILDNDSRLISQPLDVAADAIGLLFPDLEPTISSWETATNANDVRSLMARSIEGIDRLPETVRATARLLVGRGLVRLALYDEAIDIMSDLGPESTIDPAALYFYRSLAFHRLVRTEECQKSLEQLMQNKDQLPRRFAAMGQLMLADIAEVEPDSLDEIARLMQDASRHQSLSRSGPHVIEIEESVLTKLDKLIEEAEKQQQQQSANRAAPSSPLDKSRSVPGRGDGEVTDRQIGEGGAWGNLPPRERAAALMEMTRDLPPHYREVIEEYFRQLAREK